MINVMNRFHKIIPIWRLWLVAGCLWLAACGDQPGLPRLADDAVILAFGDSLTYGTGAGRSESYPAVLEALTGRRVINAGVPGEISRLGLERLSGELERHRPDLLILCHGGNDLLRKLDIDQTTENIREMVLMARQRNIPVILLGVPKPGLFLSPPDLYREIAEATESLLMEKLLAEILGETSLKSDPIHPNADGYRKMAERIATVMQRSGAI